jgi:hypothetical protein
MSDRIQHLFFSRQYEEGMALAAASDVLKLTAEPHVDAPPRRYVATFLCNTLVEAGGRVARANRVVVGIAFPEHYLHEASSYEVLNILHPSTIFHPNIRFPFICVGDLFMRPGTKLVEILYQVHAILTYSKWSANSPLCEAAAQWARRHQDELPCDRRPLKRRTLDLRISLHSQGSQP